MFSSFWQIEEEKECVRGKQQGAEVEAAGETAVVVSVSLFTVYDCTAFNSTVWQGSSWHHLPPLECICCLEKDQPG